MGAAQEVTLDLSGGDADVETSVRAAALTLGLDPEGEDSTAQDYVAAATADYRRILTALYGEGHYGPTISIRIDGVEASTIAPLDAPARIGRIVIDVEAGPVFTFGTAEVQPLAPGTELPEDFAPGQVAAADTIRQAANAGVDGWRESGRPLAAIAAQEIVARHPAEELDARVALAPGPVLTFGRPTVNGNEAVRTQRILDIAGIRVGEIYSPDEIAGAEQRLRRIAAFSSAAILEGDAPGPGETLPLEIQVQEALPRRIGFGAEVATDSGLALTGYWLHRNLLGGAESLRLDARIEDIGGTDGGIDYGLSAEFVRPATFRRDTDLTFRTALSREDAEAFVFDSFSAEATLTRYVNDDLTLEGGPGLLIAREEQDGVTRDYRLLTFPVDAVLDRRNVELNATEGYYVNLEATPFYGLDETGFGGRLYADARAYLSFGGGDRFTLAGRVQAGSVIGPDSVLDVPSNYLFYSGGGGTVRGQPFRSLSLETERDGVTFETGGRSFVGVQAEARVGITDAISAVGFYDAGIISRETFPEADDPWHAGVGIGARYDTAIGPIRLDVGTPASGDDAFEEVQVYLGIGQAF
ncbi:autotransporter assembly complex protein TamA [Wenxinia saemankumensis]|uniref:Autotransporter secretion outer membrane protein TamA n=1 Tax=Wenxinia saemankumensis TaxID=1447782 RepID=A0A1M6CC95_9RHOB|nr:BamA/TamA family outer membrane protein [Wenxinia saemankumensis]SHI58632.1 autotransporter secretion outer membrane protein TamA [Wenxinia saemankumensis]